MRDAASSTRALDLLFYPSWLERTRPSGILGSSVGERCEVSGRVLADVRPELSWKATRLVLRTAPCWPDRKHKHHLVASPNT